MHFKTLPSTPVHGVGLFPFLVLCTVILVLTSQPSLTAETAAVPVDDLEEWLGDDDAPPDDPSSTAAPWRWRLSTGLEYSAGNYGSSEHAEAWVQSVSARASTGNWTFGLNGSYQWITGPALNPLIFDDIALFFEDPLALDSLFVEEGHQGFGDVSLSARYAPDTDIFDGWYPSLAVKVKVPTAANTLGTGKVDVTMTADVAKVFGDLSVFALVSHTVRGDSASISRSNTFTGSVGTDYRISRDWSAGLSYDVRETSSRNSTVTSNLFAYGRYKVSDTVSLLGYVAPGLDNASPDTVVGLRMTLKGLW